MNIFDIIGPVMIGPSSSHTAGAARIGKIAAELFHDKIERAEIFLYGSFAKTYKGHGTDKALVGGILGMNPDDENIRRSLEIAKANNVLMRFKEETEEPEHPNTVKIVLYGANDMSMSVTGASIGGGNIKITNIDGQKVEITGQYDTLVVVHQDIPGIAGKVAEFLGNCDINVCNMALSRERRGGKAVLCIEMDGHTEMDIVSYLEHFSGVKRCILLAANGR